MKQVAVIFLALSLGACAGIEHTKKYNAVDLTHVDAGGNRWRVFDMPSQQKMMVEPSLGRAAANGFVRGLTLSVADTYIPKPEYQEAAAVWLAQTGRAQCRITDGYKLLEPSWEFVYTC